MTVQSSLSESENLTMSVPTEPDISDSSGYKLTLISWLLCSMKRAISRNANGKELASVIDCESDEFKVKEAWTMLFSLFKDAEDKTHKKKIIDIARETTAKQIEDILFQLDEVNRTP